MKCRTSLQPLTLIALVGFLSLAFAPAFAGGLWLGSQNCLHLGQNDPTGANQATKKTTLKDQFATNKINCLQEVMVTSEVANVTPGGYAYKVTAVQGKTTYKEAYAWVYTTSGISVSGSPVIYTGTGAANFDRPPAGQLFYTGTSYVWVVDYHAAFDSAPRQLELNTCDSVFTWFKARTSGVNDVVIGGDWNTPATSAYFAELKAVASQVLPDIATTISSTTGTWTTSKYDHFVWNSTNTTVNSTNREDPTGGTAWWRANISDHGGIYCWLVD